MRIYLLLVAVTAAAMMDVNETGTSEVISSFHGIKADAHSDGQTQPVKAHNFPNATQNIDKEIALFMINLKLFVSDHEFDYDCFETQVEEYMNDLADIEFAAEASGNYESWGKVGFARYVFQIMVDATQQMKRYGKSTLPVHTLVFEMIHLHVRALSMYNSQGLLDVTNKGYEVKIHNFYVTFHALLSNFRRLGIRGSRRFAFLCQAAETKDTIDSLRTHTPFPKKDRRFFHQVKYGIRS